VQNPNILLFRRYIDVIMIISYFTPLENQEFIDNLRKCYNLAITVATNQDSVNFINLKVTTSHLSSSISISPHSKNDIFYPYPSLLKRRNVTNQSQIIKAQILRTWRNSTDHRVFSFHITEYISHLKNNPYHRSIRKKLLKFLHPVKLENHLWSTEILLCPTCHLISRSNNTSIDKIMKVENKYIATKQPLNCYTGNVDLIIQEEEEVFFQIEKSSSLHDFLLTDKRQIVNI